MTPEEHLAWLAGRRSTRAFLARPIERAVLDRLIAAAVTAPSSSNRQPWRYVVVVDDGRRRAIVDAVRRASEALAATIANSPHAAELGSYPDHFWRPLAGAAAIVVPTVRRMPDTLANLVRSAGADPEAVQLPSAMPMEICATSAGVMALLLQARAEGLGACWMAGPMTAAAEIERLLEIEPGPHAYRMLGAIALGYPDDSPGEKPPRKPIDQVVRYL